MTGHTPAAADDAGPSPEPATPRPAVPEPTTPGPSAEPPGPTELTLARASTPAPAEPPLRPWRLLVQVAAAGVVVLVLVAVLGTWVSRRLAEAEAVNDAAHRTDLLASAVVQPALTDALLDGEPDAVAALDAVVRTQVLDDALVRVKIWAADGTVLYSDEERLLGLQYPLGAEEAEVLTDPATEAEVSDVSKPENVYERGEGRLLEVYRPVWTPDGTPLLFETYSRYDAVTQRSSELWRGFAGVTVSSLLLLLVLLLPVGWALLDRVRRAQDQRELALQRAVQASDGERRRIAATLHDGVVQELAGASFAVAGLADRLTAARHDALAADARGAAGAVRSSIQGLRALLVDIYPPSLARSGLEAALADLVGSLGGRGVDVTLDLPPAGLGEVGEGTARVAFRVVQETVRNALAHAGAQHVTVRARTVDDVLTVEVVDDGRGFDPALATGTPGHFGLRLLVDLAQEAGADLRLRTAPGAGCRWVMGMAVHR